MRSFAPIVCTLLGCAILFSGHLSAFAQEDEERIIKETPLWDLEEYQAGAPTEGKLAEAWTEENMPDLPSLTWFPPFTEETAKTAVVVCPGGGYRGLATDHEGFQIASWLNSMGVYAVMLKYRRSPHYMHPAPLQDVQRALRTVRSRADELGVSPDRIGVMGFSAGGHLASSAGTHTVEGDPDSENPIEQVGSRPDFMILAYPVISFVDDNVTHGGSKRNLLGKNPSEELIKKMSSELQVNADTPPTFLFHTTTDAAVPVQNSLLFFMALQEAGVSSELHAYQEGKHGVGLAPEDPILSSWPSRCADWLRLHGWVK
ncbi:Acetylxylan esterase [Planctomycetales bacterium 10988]|nr:Acetylxylan esterase [Planctomycetales bacterium 10988]